MRSLRSLTRWFRRSFGEVIEEVVEKFVVEVKIHANFVLLVIFCKKVCLRGKGMLLRRSFRRSLRKGRRSFTSLLRRSLGRSIEGWT